MGQNDSTVADEEYEIEVKVKDLNMVASNIPQTLIISKVMSHSPNEQKSNDKENRSPTKRGKRKSQVLHADSDDNNELNTTDNTDPEYIPTSIHINPVA